jgi:hypothetical protein
MGDCSCSDVDCETATPFCYNECCRARSMFRIMASNWFSAFGIGVLVGGYGAVVVMRQRRPLVG